MSWQRLISKEDILPWRKGPVSKVDIVLRHSASIQRGFALLWQKCQYPIGYGIVPASKEDLFWQKYQNPKRIYYEYGICAIIQGGFIMNMA